MKTTILLLLLPLIACSQNPVNLKPLPPPMQAAIPAGVIERLRLDTATATRDGVSLIRSITITAGSVTFVLTKQPAANQVITVSLGQMTQRFIPDPAQTALNQKTLVISLPDPPYGTEPVVIQYVTTEVLP